jgi:hypothetical protein
MHFPIEMLEIIPVYKYYNRIAEGTFNNSTNLKTIKCLASFPPEEIKNRLIFYTFYK